MAIFYIFSKPEIVSISPHTEDSRLCRDNKTAKAHPFSKRDRQFVFSRQAGCRVIWLQLIL